MHDPFHLSFTDANYVANILAPEWSCLQDASPCTTRSIFLSLMQIMSQTFCLGPIHGEAE